MAEEEDGNESEEVDSDGLFGGLEGGIETRVEWSRGEGQERSSQPGSRTTIMVTG